MNHEPSHSPSELIQSSIQLIQKLRAGVGQVFKDLSDGISENIEDSSTKDDADPTGGGAGGLKDKTLHSQKDSTGADKTDDQQEKHRAILRVLKRSLETISHDFR